MRRSWLIMFILMLAACAGGSADPTPPFTGWPGVDDPLVTVNYDAGITAIRRLNEYRVAASQPQAALDYDLSRGCQLHANYLELNRLDLNQLALAAHTQHPERPGYSYEGAVAAQNAIIYQHVDPLTAIDNWMGTFYHRLGLMDPNLYIIGFGSTTDYQVLDNTRGRIRGESARDAYALFPSPGMQYAPSVYQQEIPHPVPGDTELGVPITVEFYGELGLLIRDVSARLTDTTAAVEVEFYLTFPGQPLLAEHDVPQVIGLFPSAPLVAGHTYNVQIDAEIDGSSWSAGWSFTTSP